ncbi:hypothetical protein [Marinibactrum halimedae]|uniref:Uncharacterized protein n=1 Tax=Marinibactrum halimedae TaxID=1444977 RepID=A0AA37T6E6_9GAMM|nr:hypothetical protein [Marinibactrum halimedae]MCD9458047.1 hypothetical protein [Marinibactrum halimedae]GLS27674.1 hypothetical protein GCM10007877_33930 [Marinibactrum halimedae]
MSNASMPPLSASTLNIKPWCAAIVVVFIGVLSGCATTVVKSTNQTQLQLENQYIAENELLDVGIVVFDPGIENIDDDDAIVFPEIRKAESHYMPYQLMDAMQRSAAWGAVRVVPNGSAAVDVLVTGDIKESDGELLVLEVNATDSSGKTWFTKEYKRKASRYSYDRKVNAPNDPFSGVYNEIANDLLTYKRKMRSVELQNLRVITELKFAKDFSPEAFQQHVSVNKEGIYEIHRLPANNDPMLERIRNIRERDYLFVDTLQEYYGSFVREMETPYDQWRSQSYQEAMAIRELKSQSRNRTIAGVAAVVGGIMAAGSGSGSAAAAGQIGVIGGGYLIKDGFDRRSDAKMHVEALQELGYSLESDMEPHFIELEDRTITLSGSVENQYEQWREILRDIYRVETGGVLSQSEPTTRP